MRLEHQGEVGAIALLPQVVRQIVPIEIGFYRAVLKALLETAADQRGRVIFGERPGVRHFDNQTVRRQNLLKTDDLLKDLAFGGKRIINLDADIHARPEDLTKLLHDLVSILKLISHIGLGVIDEAVLNDCGIAGQVGDKVLDGLNLVGVSAVRRVQHPRRAFHAVFAIRNIAR